MIGMSLNILVLWVVITSLVIFAFWRNDRELEPFHFVMGSFMGVVFTVMALLLLSLVVNICGDEYNRLEGESKLVSTRTSSSVSGAFVFGTGSIESGFLYTIFAQRADGGIHSSSYDQRQVVVFEDSDPKSAHIKRYTVRKTVPKYLKGWVLDAAESEFYEIHVPKGSVLREWKI